jgi:hypothetical protein
MESSALLILRPKCYGYIKERRKGHQDIQQAWRIKN